VRLPRHNGGRFEGMPEELTPMYGVDDIVNGAIEANPVGGATDQDMEAVERNVRAYRSKRQVMLVYSTASPCTTTR